MDKVSRLIEFGKLPWCITDWYVKLSIIIVFAALGIVCALIVLEILLVVTC